MGNKGTLYKKFAKDHTLSEAIAFACRLLGLDAPADKEDTGWRTTENGKHYHIDPEGNVDKGPKAMVGSNVNEPDTWDNEQPISKREKSRFIYGALPQFKSLSEKAKKHSESYEEWSTELTVEECEAIQDNYQKMSATDPNFADDDHYESISDYYERMHRMLAASADGKTHENKPVDGKDISEGYNWDGKPYTDTKYGQVIDTAIEDIICKQGFDGVPKMMKKEDFDKYLEEHPSSPVMLRTYSAPNQEMLEGYDSDLEHGAWYVDCGVGGNAHGQGMYTAYSDAFNQIKTLNDKSLWEAALKNGDFTKEYIHDDMTDTYYVAGFTTPVDGKSLSYIHPGQLLIFHDKDSGEGRMLYCTKSIKEEPAESWRDASTGEDIHMSEYEFEEKYDYMAMASKVEEEEVPKPGRDLTRPLGQMRMYINLNENREGFGKNKNLYLKVSSEAHIPEVADIGDRKYKLTGEAFDIPSDIGTIEDGTYLVGYNSPMGGGYSLNPLIVKDGKFTDPTGMYSEEKTMVNIASLSKHGGMLYPATDIGHADVVSTTTRKMTLDPSAKLIKEYEIKDKLIPKMYDLIVKNPTEQQLLTVIAMHHNREPSLIEVNDYDVEEITYAIGNLSKEQQEEILGGKDIDPYENPYVKQWIKETIRAAVSEEASSAYYSMPGTYDPFKDSEFSHNVRDENESFFGISAVKRAVDNAKKKSMEKARKDWLLHDLIDADTRQYLLSEEMQDVGVVAAMFGYDGIIGCDGHTCPNYGQTIVVLNRSKLILSDERVEVPEDIPT